MMIGQNEIHSFVFTRYPNEIFHQIELTLICDETINMKTLDSIFVNSIKNIVEWGHGKLFVTPKFFVAAKIRQFSGDGTSDDDDNITINANMRF